MISRPNRHRPGASVVEFAVIAPVIFVILFGIIEVGRAFMVLHLLSEVARESARYAVVTEGANDSTANIQTYASGRLSAFGLSTTNTPVVYVNDSSSTDLSAASGPCQQAGASNFGKYTKGSEVTVQVQVNFSEVTWMPFADYLAGNAKLTGQYTLRRDPM